MGGLAILVLIVLYIAVAVWVVGRQKSGRAKIIALVIALLIPTADAIIGRIYLQHLCDTEGGLKVNRVVEGVEGFMNMRTPDDYGYWVQKHGYSFSECRPSNGKVIRYSSLNGTDILKEKNVKPKSKYRLRNFTSDNWIRRIRNWSEVIETQEVLAAYTTFTFRGGWVERFLAQFSDAGAGNVAFCEEAKTHSGKWVEVQIVSNSLKR